MRADMTKFEVELQHLINCHSVENESNTPDFMLANFLRRQLDIWNEMTRARDNWYGVHLSPGSSKFISDHPKGCPCPSCECPTKPVMEALERLKVTAAAKDELSPYALTLVGLLLEKLGGKVTLTAEELITAPHKRKISSEREVSTQSIVFMVEDSND